MRLAGYANSLKQGDKDGGEDMFAKDPQVDMVTQRRRSHFSDFVNRRTITPYLSKGNTVIRYARMRSWNAVTRNMSSM